MNRHDRRRARRLLGCTSVYYACEVTGYSSGHQAADCDGSCHTAAQLAAFDEEQALKQISQVRIDFDVAAMLADEFDDEGLVPGLLFLVAAMIASGRAVADLWGRLTAAFLTLAYRRIALARLAFETRSRRAGQETRVRRLDHLTAAPRTGPPAGPVAIFATGGALRICT